MFVWIFLYSIAIKYGLARSIWSNVVTFELDLLKMTQKNTGLLKKFLFENSAWLWLDCETQT